MSTSISVEFPFPREEDGAFRYIPELTLNPEMDPELSDLYYKADETFIEKLAELSDDSDAANMTFMRTLARNPWLKPYLLNEYGHGTTGAVLVREDIEGKTVFRGESSAEWHIDFFPSYEDWITTFNTSTSTEIAGFTAEFLEEHPRYFDLAGTLSSPKSTEAAVSSMIKLALNDTSDLLKGDWLEEAGGLVHADEERLQTIAKYIKIKNLVIAQLMPCVAYTAKNDRAPHRSAVWHPSQPKVRAFGRGFTRQPQLGKILPQPAKELVH